MLTATRHNELRMRTQIIVQRQSFHVNRGGTKPWLHRQATNNFGAARKSASALVVHTLNEKAVPRQAAWAVLTRCPKTRESLNV